MAASARESPEIGCLAVDANRVHVTPARHGGEEGVANDEGDRGKDDGHRDARRTLSEKEEGLGEAIHRVGRNEEC